MDVIPVPHEPQPLHRNLTPIKLRVSNGLVGRHDLCCRLG